MPESGGLEIVDFETGDYSQFNATDFGSDGNQINVAGTHLCHGSYGAQFYFNGVNAVCKGILNDFGTQGDLNLRVYFKLPTGAYPNYNSGTLQSWTFFTLDSTIYGAMGNILIRVNSGNHYLYRYAYRDDSGFQIKTPSSQNITLDTWHYVEWQFRQGAGAGSCTVYYDGGEWAGETGLTISKTIDNIGVGCHSIGAIPALGEYFLIDDIKLNIVYIGAYSEGEPEGLSISVYDGLSMSEVIGKDMPLGPISKHENITLSEVISMLKDILPSVHENITVAEVVQIIKDLKPEVFDSLSISEWVNIIRSVLNISVSDQITFAESISIIEGILIFVYDSFEIEEGKQILLNILSVFDNLTIQEQISILKDITISTFDSLTIEEQVSIFKDILISSFDSFTIQEQIEILKDILIAAHDSFTLEEQIAINKDILISVHDDLSFEEYARVSSNYTISLFDALTIIENVLLSIPINITIHDALTISENLNLNIPISASAIDNLTIAEYIQMSMILASGLVTVTLSSRQPGISFTSRDPTVNFTEG